MEYESRSLTLSKIAVIGGSMAVYTPVMATLNFEKRVDYMESDIRMNIYRVKREMQGKVFYA